MTTRSKITTQLLYILDESGSMEDIKDSVISGFNEYINGLRKKAFKVTLTKFDTLGIRTPYTALDVKKVPRLNQETYKPNAGTPLYDACVEAIENLSEKVKDNQPVLVCIMTDGQENSSTKHTAYCLKDLIHKLTHKGNWTFVFMGANQDSWSTASQIGISAGNVANWTPSVAGVGTYFRGLSQDTAFYAMSMEENSKKGINMTSAAFVNNLKNTT